MTSAAAPLRITAAANTALQNHGAKLAHLVDSLCPEGRGVYRALQATMSLAVAQDDIVHFESAFRKELERFIDDGVELVRIASGQWKCSSRGEEFVVSIRTEVLGASLDEAFEFLSRLKCQARVARSMLLGENAQWMRQLSRGGDKKEFLRACRCAPEERSVTARLQRPGLDWDDDMCSFCGKPESSARLAGKHKCHVIATFRCSGCRGKWSSFQARFNPEEERVLGQKCQTCYQSGEVIDWNFSDKLDGSNQGREHERKPHRSDLCEACGSFGNCQGAFFEPFIMSAAIALLTKQCATQWATSGDILVADAGLHSVAMMPHVSTSVNAPSAFFGGSSWSSRDRCNGKASIESGQGAVAGGKKFVNAAKGCTKGKGCAKGGNAGKDGSGGKKGKGKGEGKAGQFCRDWQAGNCRFAERCRFLHD